MASASPTSVYDLLSTRVERTDRDKLDNTEVQRVFRATLVTDLARVEVDDITARTNDPDAKFNIKVLCRYLDDLMGVEDSLSDFKSTLSAFRASRVVFASVRELISASIVRKDDGVGLNLSGKVCTNMNTLRSRISIGQVAEDLSSSEYVALDQFSFLDLSDCTLMDVDIPDVLRIVSYLPRVSTVILRNNYVTGKDDVWPQFDRLVHEDRLRFLDISLNPAASYSHLDFIARMNVSWFSKVIFVLEPHIDLLEWERVLSPTQQESTSIIWNTHMDYYSFLETSGVRVGNRRRTSDLENAILSARVGDFRDSNSDQRILLCSQLSKTLTDAGFVWPRARVSRFLFNALRSYR